MTLPAQHTTFNTLDNWAIKPPPNQKRKGPERKGYRVMARNMYTIHSVTFVSCLFLSSSSFHIQRWVYSAERHQRSICCVPISISSSPSISGCTLPKVTDSPFVACPLFAPYSEVSNALCLQRACSKVWGGMGWGGGGMYIYSLLLLTCK